jgi:hypothetical protein
VKISSEIQKIFNKFFNIKNINDKLEYSNEKLFSIIEEINIY